MSDDGMDPCECIWGHELAMRRLLNMIRNSQSVCTDNECFEEGFQNQDSDHTTLLMTVFVFAALLLMYIRPRFGRAIQDVTKPSSSGSGQNGEPPNPPAPMF